MTGRALVVAAHGSSEPAVNEGIRELARRVGRRLGFDEAIAAFHQGEPAFSRALDDLSSDQVVVVPLLQCEGYYCRRVLPAELARNRRFPSLRLRQTQAVGVHPRLDEALARRVAELVARHALAKPAVALVGHGTARHRGSRQAAEASARELEGRTGLPARAFFLDEEPAVESVARYAPAADVVVVPLLIGAGRHATRDLESRLGVSATGDALGAHDFERGDRAGGAAVWARAGGSTLLLDRPFGLDPAIEDLVADLASAPC